MRKDLYVSRTAELSNCGPSSHDAHPYENLNDLVSRRLSPLCRAIRRGFTRAPADFIQTAVIDAIRQYSEHPEQFDSSCGVPLERFLLRAARCNLIDLLRTETKRQAIEAEYARQLVWETGRSEVPPGVELHEAAPARERILAVARTNAERKAMEIWLDQGSTEEIAQALGFIPVSASEQRAEVHRFKTRMQRRLRRQFPETTNQREKDKRVTVEVSHGI